MIEEKIFGPEFSLMFFADGETAVPMPVVQDHKRTFADDTGPNTGGMGSWSGADLSLPFLVPADLAAAQRITDEVMAALAQECGAPFCGVMYGGFMLTKDGVRLIEYNARFGDPEALNVLSLLKTDLVEIGLAAAAGRLRAVKIEFEHQATVCKYVVPEGYPERPKAGKAISVGELPPGCELFYAAVDQNEAGEILTSSSRAVALLGKAPTLAEAERIAEAGAGAVSGPVRHRSDIGTARLIASRVRPETISE